MSNVERIIAYYDKSRDKFIDEYIIEIDANVLRDLWAAYDDDPLYYKIYPVGLNQKRKIEELLRVELHFEKFDYFLECHSV